MQKELESRALSLIRDHKTFNEFQKHGITSECFVIYTELFDFINNYFHKYDSIPAEAVIKTNFPEFVPLPDVKPEEIRYLSEELTKSNVQRRAIKIINDSSEMIDTDPYGTIETMIHRLSSVRQKAVESRSYMDKEAVKRYNLVMANREKAGKGMTVGLKTGIGIFDTKYIGWQPGDLIAIMGRMGIGKSWVLIYSSCVCYDSGKRVLYLSPEMSNTEVELRTDTVLGHIRGHKFLNDKLQEGSIDFKEYKTYLESLSSRSDWLGLDSYNGRPFSVTNIAGLIDEFNPDLVAIDGIGLLEGWQKEAWQKNQEISRGLKNLAQTKKVVIMTTSQVNRATLDKRADSKDNVPGTEATMPGLENLYMGDALGQDASVVIAMNQDINKPDVRYITIPKRRNGKAINRPLEIKFDVNSGIISI